jgi:hypothetical protein
MALPHTHAKRVTGRHIGLSIVLTLTIVVGELVAGYFANSLALLSDAGHNFADALALVFSWYAIRMARRPSDSKRTFGYHRVGNDDVTTTGNNARSNGPDVEVMGIDHPWNVAECLLQRSNVKILRGCF